MEVAGAMAAKESMPFYSQRLVPQHHIKVLRLAEACCLLPVALAALSWSAVLVYKLGVAILGVIYVAAWMSTTWGRICGRRLGISHVLLPVVFRRPGHALLHMEWPLLSVRETVFGPEFPFQIMNPKAFGLLSVGLATLLWPLNSLWSGSFGDAAGQGSTRDWVAQALLPAMPPRAHYAGRVVLSLCCCALVLAANLGFQNLSMGYLSAVSQNWGPTTTK